MIICVEGKGVGAGKSYWVAEDALNHFRRGGTAYVSESFHLDWDECKAYARRKWGVLLEDDQYRSVTSEQIYRLHEHTPPGTEECPVKIYVDEAQDQLNARDWNDKNKRGLFQWCCQSRHDDNDLIFVSQSAANIDKQIRRLATFTWSIRNSNNFSAPGFGNMALAIKVLTLGLNNGFYFIRTLLDYDGKTILERKWAKADLAIFKCYHSKSMRLQRKRSGEPVARKQLQIEKGKGKMGKVLIMIAVVGSIFGFYKLRNGFGSKPAETRTASQMAAASSPSASPSGFPKYKLEHEPWRSIGKQYVRLESGTYTIHKMSPRGFVEAIDGTVVRVRQPDGELLYIVGEDEKRIGLPPSAIASAPAPTVAPKPPIIIKAPEHEALTMTKTW